LKGSRPKFEKLDKKEIKSWQLNCWDISQEQGNVQRETGHPAMYPVELPYRCIKSYSLKNEIVHDPFLGSGSTMVAAEQTGRICYGMELDPKYCAVILERMKDLGIEGVLTNG